MKFVKALVITLAVVFLMAGETARADDSDLTFYVQSYHPNVVDVEFYSQRYDRAWPGGGQVYSLKDSEVHEFTLACESGEKICYGAWVRGTESKEWGVGLDDQYNCDRCCYRCTGGETPILVLE